MHTITTTTTPEHPKQRRRDRVLEFRQLFLEWVQRVCRAKNLPEEVAAVAGGEVCC